MTLAEFESGGFVCHKCGGKDGEYRPNPNMGFDHPGGAQCRNCRCIIWFKKETTPKSRRPPIDSTVRDQTWRQYGDTCVHCGLSKESLSTLGLSLTVQHVPPYCEVGHKATLLPYCQWCQQDSATKWKQRTSLLTRLANPQTREALAKLWESIEKDQQ